MCLSFWKLQCWCQIFIVWLDSTTFRDRFCTLYHGKFSIKRSPNENFWWDVFFWRPHYLTFTSHSYWIAPTFSSSSCRFRRSLINSTKKQIADYQVDGNQPHCLLDDDKYSNSCKSSPSHCHPWQVFRSSALQKRFMRLCDETLTLKCFISFFVVASGCLPV